MVFSITKLDYYFLPFLRVLQPVTTLFLAVLVYWILHPGAARFRSILDHWPGKVVVALAITASASAVFGISQGRAGSYILHNYSKILLFWVYFTAVLRTPESLKRGVWAFFLSCAVVAFISLFLVGVSKRAGHVAYDANDTGLLMVAALPLGAWLLRASSTKGKWLALPRPARQAGRTCALR